MSDDNAASEIPADIPAEVPMVRGPNGGMLRRGGTNKGAGRPPNVIKARCRKDFYEVLPLLKEMAKGRGKDKSGKAIDLDIKFADRIRAIDVLGKHGLDSNVTLTDVREALRLTRETIGEFMSREQADALWSMIIPHWLKL